MVENGISEETLIFSSIMISPCLGHIYLLRDLYVVVFFFDVGILLPIAVAVRIVEEKRIKCFPHH